MIGTCDGKLKLEQRTFPASGRKVSQEVFLFSEVRAVLLSLIRLDSLRGGKTHVFGYESVVRDCVVENVSFPLLRSPSGAAFAHPARPAARGEDSRLLLRGGGRGCVAENVSFPWL